jgi:hypothetical protein
MKPSRKRSNTSSWTMKRVGLTQTWPALRYLPATAVSSTRSTSTSPNTSTGPWPPSSIVVPLHVLGGELGEVLADHGRAGEAELADDRASRAGGG